MKAQGYGETRKIEQNQMRDLIQELWIALSMYSAFPTPKTEWNERNMSGSICFFPLVGIIAGLMEYGIWMLLERIGTGPLLNAAVLSVLPAAVSGGIHLDGFLDTCDALGSWRSPEEKLEIMKDSHSGAFAVIGGVFWGILTLGAMSCADRTMILAVSAGFVLSRGYSGLGLLLLKKAKKTGLARTFSEHAETKRNIVILVIWILAASLAMILAARLTGLVCAICALACFLWYSRMSMRQFGGITGDTEGFFLVVCELVIALSAAVMEGLIS